MTTLSRGTITTWNDQKGYGFITPEDGSPRVFFHISGVVGQRGRPVEQTEVLYMLTCDDQNRLRAVQVQSVQAFAPRRQSYGGHIIVLTIAALFFALLAGATVIFQLPTLVIIVYLTSSLLALLLYAYDKSCAMQDTRRVPESTLHLIELLCGWPGALVAQEFFRHKTVKRSFQTSFWSMVTLNLIGLGAYSGIYLFSGELLF